MHLQIMIFGLNLLNTDATADSGFWFFLFYADASADNVFWAQFAKHRRASADVHLCIMCAPLLRLQIKDQ